MGVSNTLSAWGICTDCGYRGMIEYRPVAGEVYDDPDALGVILSQHCPACETADNTLLPLEYYQEILAGSRTGEES